VPELPWISFAYPHREHAALRDAIEHAATRILRSGEYILGPEVQHFESAFSTYTNSPHTIAVSSGTDALVCSLLALGIGNKHEVIVPAFGFPAAAETAIRVGATPVFVDIEPNTLGPNPTECAKARSPRTGAIIVMHLFGQAVDLNPITDAIPNTPIIEDAAQAIGTLSRNQHVGTIGNAGTFSFFPAKSLGAAGDAGAVITRDPELAKRVRIARIHGSTNAYEWNSIGGNYRMDAFQAAILSVKLQSLKSRIHRRQSIGAQLDALFSSHNIQVFRGSKDCSPTYAPFVIRTPHRDQILADLRNHRIDARVHYPITLPAAPAFQTYARQQNYPQATLTTSQLLNLPYNPELNDNEVERLLNTISEVLRA